GDPADHFTFRGDEKLRGYHPADQSEECTVYQRHNAEGQSACTECDVQHIWKQYAVPSVQRHHQFQSPSLSYRLRCDIAEVQQMEEWTVGRIGKSAERRFWRVLYTFIYLSMRRCPYYRFGIDDRYTAVFYTGPSNSVEGCQIGFYEITLVFDFWRKG